MNSPQQSQLTTSELREEQPHPERQHTWSPLQYNRSQQQYLATMERPHSAMAEINLNVQARPSHHSAVTQSSSSSTLSQQASVISPTPATASTLSQSPTRPTGGLVGSEEKEEKIPTNPLRKRNWRRPQSECRVCNSSPCAYSFYGAIVCDSCRTFFRRQVLTQKSLRCLWGRRCAITVKTRKDCAMCRWTKCLSVGMNPELVTSMDKGVIAGQKMGNPREVAGTYQPKVSSVTSPYPSFRGGEQHSLEQTGHIPGRGYEDLYRTEPQQSQRYLHPPEDSYHSRDGSSFHVIQQPSPPSPGFSPPSYNPYYDSYQAMSQSTLEEQEQNQSCCPTSPHIPTTTTSSCQIENSNKSLPARGSCCGETPCSVPYSSSASCSPQSTPHETQMSSTQTPPSTQLFDESKISKLLKSSHKQQKENMRLYPDNETAVRLNPHIKVEGALNIPCVQYCLFLTTLEPVNGPLLPQKSEMEPIDEAILLKMERVDQHPPRERSNTMDTNISMAAQMSSSNQSANYGTETTRTISVIDEMEQDLESDSEDSQNNAIDFSLSNLQEATTVLTPGQAIPMGWIPTTTATSNTDRSSVSGEEHCSTAGSTGSNGSNGRQVHIKGEPFSSFSASSPSSSSSSSHCVTVENCSSSNYVTPSPSLSSESRTENDKQPSGNEGGPQIAGEIIFSAIQDKEGKRSLGSSSSSSTGQSIRSSDSPNSYIRPPSLPSFLDSFGPGQPNQLSSHVEFLSQLDESFLPRQVFTLMYNYLPTREEKERWVNLVDVTQELRQKIMVPDCRDITTMESFRDCEECKCNQNMACRSYVITMNLEAMSKAVIHATGRSIPFSKISIDDRATLWMHGMIELFWMCSCAFYERTLEGWDFFTNGDRVFRIVYPLAAWSEAEMMMPHAPQESVMVKNFLMFMSEFDDDVRLDCFLVHIMAFMTIFKDRPGLLFPHFVEKERGILWKTLENYVKLRFAPSRVSPILHSIGDIIKRMSEVSYVHERLIVENSEALSAVITGMAGLGC